MLKYNVIIPKIILITFVYQMSLYYNDMYNTKIIRTAQEIVIRSLQAVGAAAVILSIIYYIIPDLIIGRGVFLISIIFLTIITILWRLFYSWTISINAFDEKILIIGTGNTAKDIAKGFLAKKRWDIR